ncbi:hypothetical protein [Streptomyces sp. LaPpAH-108]|uniref:hypothetical protein n=1 Tax=Streptomyces sp. LaPpAH-108 TaxID=1155714 RepID=UPI0003757277|nr:hypothetical protein [Streptomyces sp. LaPpAH-108]
MNFPDPQQTPDLHSMWADAHVSYSSPTGPVDLGRPRGALAEQETAWRIRLTETAPNGGLLVENSMFDALRSADTLHLLHVTQSLDRITRHGTLRPSGGCLVGSIYCAPLTPAAEGLRMHNLAEYILTKEAPAAVARSSFPGRTTTPLVLQLSLPNHTYRGLTGIDYLRLGAIHLRNYLDREFLLGREERYLLRETVVNRVKNSVGFLHLAATIAIKPEPAEHEAFSRLLSETITRLPILGYICFEALSEYLMLYSRSTQTRQLAERGELNNWLSKQLLFDGSPGTTGHFDLARFRPDFTRLEELLYQIDPTIDTTHAGAHLTARISHLTAARLLGSETPPEEAHRTRWDFGNVVKSFGPLLGHLIHRELRRFRRYPDFYHFYDQDKAFQAWNYWNQLDIPLPFNGTIPKGEIGINPAYPDLQYTAWTAELGDDGLLHLAEEIPLCLTPRLVGTQYGIMRDRRTWTRRTGSTGNRALTDSSV